MHPAIMQQLADDHIREMHAKAEDERRARQARQARRRAPSTRLRLPASGTLSYDDPRLDAGRRSAMTGQRSAPPLPVMVASPPDGGDATMRRRALDHATDQRGRGRLSRGPAGKNALPGDLVQDGGGRIRRVQ